MPSGKQGKGFTVVDVGDNGEIADMGLVEHIKSLLWKSTLPAHSASKRFARQNLAAGGIHFRRGCEIKIGIPGLPSGKQGKGFTVVDVGDDGEIADMGLVEHIKKPPLEIHAARA